MPTKSDCETCGRAFSDIKRHVNTQHVNVRPYKCVACDKGFSEGYCELLSTRFSSTFFSQTATNTSAKRTTTIDVNRQRKVLTKTTNSALH